MLDHLLQKEYEPDILEAPFNFASVKKASATQMLDAQSNTADWLRELGASSDEDILEEEQQAVARDAFRALTTNANDAKEVLSKVTQPEAVRRIVGMLSTYEWAFVEQAQQLRSMAVSKIVEETDHPDARIRLKALEMLGRVTEVGLFTDRIEVKKTDMTNEELDAKIKDKLSQLSKAMQVQNKQPVEISDAEYVVEKQVDAATD